MSHIWVSHVTHIFKWVMPIHENHEIWKWVTSHIWMSHVTHMNESCHTYGRVMWHVWMIQVTYMNESCHTYEWVMLHMQMRCVAHTTKSRHTFKQTHTTHKYIQTTWLERESARARAWENPWGWWRMSRRHVTHMNEFCHTYEWVLSLIWMSHVTHMHESCHSYEWAMSRMRTNTSRTHEHRHVT